MPVLMLIQMRHSGIIYKDDSDFIIADVGYVTPCCIIFSIWINDTMAYLVGSFIGKTPLTKISPKKTWEGTIGGIILCTVAIGFLYPLLFWKEVLLTTIPANIWFIIPSICAIFGTLGDLFESKLKRMADVKDSGSFMPGHGGFLDRFDSLLVAIPFVWLYIKLFV
jgi:phosphatidate cytidylyltransferase